MGTGYLRITEKKLREEMANTAIFILLFLETIKTNEGCYELSLPWIEGRTPMHTNHISNSPNYRKEKL